MYRLRTVFTGPAGSPWLSTMFFHELGGSPEDAAAAVGAWWGTVDSLIVNDVSWATEGDVALVDEVTGEITGFESATVQSGTGASASDALPWVVQGLIRWRTAAVVNGRGVRGRNFIPGLSEGVNDNGVVAAVNKATVDAAAATLAGDIDSSMVIWHRPNEEESTPGSAHTVIVGTMWTSFAELRTRRD
jgi:hypothetical protein